MKSGVFYIKQKRVLISKRKGIRFSHKFSDRYYGFATQNVFIQGANKEGILAARARRAEVSDRKSNDVETRFDKQTEREGFEPSVELPLHQFSRLTP